MKSTHRGSSPSALRASAIAALVLISATAANCALAQDFALKDYRLGAPMERCPESATKVVPDGPSTTCILGPTTLANQLATEHLVTIYESKISAVTYRLASKGASANSDLLATLKEKFGEPDFSKPHLNEYIWGRDTKRMIFDGWKGYVLLVDRTASDEARKKKAISNKSDL